MDEGWIKLQTFTQETHRLESCMNQKTLMFVLDDLIFYLFSHSSFRFSQQPSLVKLKGEFTRKWKFSHYLLTLMLIDGQVKFFSPQNTAGICKNMGSMTFFKTTSGAFSGFIIYFLKHFNPSCHSLQSATPFSCEAPAVFCELKNFTRPSIRMRMSR